MPSLLSMNELVMNEILKCLDFRQVQTLRKVCHDLRNFIDEHKPDAKFEAIRLDVHNTYILAVYNTCHKTYRVEYGVRGFTHDIGTVQNNMGYPYYMERFLKDIAIVLSFQSSTMKVLSLYQRGNQTDNYSKTLKVLTSILNSREPLLKTKALKMDVCNEHQILSILPYLDSNFLEVLEIQDPHDSTQPIEVKDVVKLEQWKKAREIRVLSRRITYRLEDFEHLSGVHWNFDRLHGEQVEGVKKTFLHSSYMNYFFFHFFNFENEEEYLRSLGHPNEINGSKVWYFRMKDSREVLEITRRLQFKGIIFKRILASIVPEGSVVQD